MHNFATHLHRVVSVVTLLKQLKRHVVCRSVSGSDKITDDASNSHLITWNFKYWQMCLWCTLLTEGGRSRDTMRTVISELTDRKHSPHSPLNCVIKHYSLTYSEFMFTYPSSCNNHHHHQQQQQHTTTTTTITTNKETFFARDVQ